MLPEGRRWSRGHAVGTGEMAANPHATSTRALHPGEPASNEGLHVRNHNNEQTRRIIPQHRAVTARAVNTGHVRFSKLIPFLMRPLVVTGGLTIRDGIRELMPSDVSRTFARSDVVDRDGA